MIANLKCSNDINNIKHTDNRKKCCITKSNTTNTKNIDESKRTNDSSDEEKESITESTSGSYENLVKR